MAPLLAYAGNNLMNLVTSKVYAAERRLFKGSGTSGGLNYTYDVTEAPIAKLVHGSARHNLEFDLKKVAITAKGTLLDFQRTLRMKATGRLAIVAGALTLTGLEVTTNSTSALDQLVVGIIQSQIQPKIATALASIPIPQLNDIFSTGLSAAPREGGVIRGPALEVQARVTGKNGLASADAPTAASIRLLNDGTATDAKMIGVVSEDAIQALIKALVPPLSHAFDEIRTKGEFSAGIKGTIKATTPLLRIRNGVGEATTTISFSKLKGGIQVPLLGWTWVSLPAPTIKAAITHSLSASGNEVLVKLTGVRSLRVSLNWPAVLRPVEVVLGALLNSVLTLFRGKISAAVAGRKLELFQLPPKVPGTNINATLSFASGGLAYFKSSVQAIVRIRT
ncbi:MAG: hypothetical protein JNM84_04780 [Planctomycetes bacterium]|nr:hypothetical protein [Planctomycetota bacterium]